MSLTYDGIIHRSLEEQVRYDAEQVQALKQADVTINENLQTVNENLQTINTEINGKLNKPTNPSAESAVTMLADGTVGTKLLSEIGGGGNLYRHIVSMKHVSLGTLSFISVSCIKYSFTIDNYANFPMFVVFLNDYRPSFNGKAVKAIDKYEKGEYPDGNRGRGIRITFTDDTTTYEEFQNFVGEPTYDSVKEE